MSLFNFFKKNITNGEVVNRHENGKIKERYFVAGGKKYGNYKRYYENGKLEYEGEYERDNPKGVHISFYKNGKIKSEKNYNKLTLEETSKKSIKNKGKIVINENEYLKKEFNFSISETLDLKEEYFESGEILSKAFFNKNGLQDGIEQRFDINGNLWSESMWSQGRRNGKRIFYYKNGKPLPNLLRGTIKTVENWVDNDKVGKQLYYYENSKLEMIDDFQKVWRVVNFYNDEGKIEKQRKNLRKNPSVEVEIEFDINGNIIKKVDEVQDNLEDFYEVTETNVVLYNKSGKEIASGFICFSIYLNQYDDGHCERCEEDFIMIDNGKLFNDGDAENEYEYDTVVWDEERLLEEFTTYDDALSYYNAITKHN